VITFSLVDLESDAERQECVRTLRLQLNSFALYALSTPLLLVGTRKADVKGGAAKLKVLSAVLERELKYCPNFEQLQRNDGEGLVFYGVENSAGIGGDETIRSLVGAIEAAARGLPSMKTLIPPGWVAVYDELTKLHKASERPHLSLTELISIAEGCGLPHKPETMSLECEVSAMLRSLPACDYCSLLAAHYSLLTTHCSLLAAHCSLLTAHCSLLTAHCSPHCSLLTAHCPLPTAHYSLLQVDAMLGYLHALGAVLWYDLPKLRELVIIDSELSQLQSLLDNCSMNISQ
jgi:hypothetical protein